jgi:hypothetical protein
MCSTACKQEKQERKDVSFSSRAIVNQDGEGMVQVQRRFGFRRGWVQMFQSVAGESKDERE